MKKRILSLILAFAMAATLAPATALVGSNTAKAAVSAPTFTLVAKESSNEVALTLVDEEGAKNYDNTASTTLKADTQYTLSIKNTNSSNLSAVDGKFKGIKYDIDNVDEGTTGKNVDAVLTGGTNVSTSSIFSAVSTDIASATDETIKFTTPAATKADQIISIKVEADANDLASASWVDSSPSVKVTKYFKFKVAAAGGPQTVAAPALTVADASATAIEVFPGQKYTVNVVDGTTGSAGEMYFVKGTPSNSIASTKNNVVVRTGTGTYTVGDVVEVSKSATPGAEFTVAYQATYENGGSKTTTVNDTVTVRFKVKAHTSIGGTGLSGAATIGGKALQTTEASAVTPANQVAIAVGAPVTLTTGSTLTIDGGTANSYVASDAQIRLTPTSVGRNLAITYNNTQASVAGSLTGNALTFADGATQTFTFGSVSFALPAGSPVGIYTYKVEYLLNGSVVATRYIAFATAEVKNAILDADGGVVSNVGWELKDGLYYGEASKSGAQWQVTLPNARKEGYVFKGWVYTSNPNLPATPLVAGSTDTTAVPSYKAVYDEFATYNIFTGITNTGMGAVDYSKTVIPVSGRKLGDKIAPEKFSRAGYTFLGFSTEMGASKALWGPDATLTNEVIQAMESTRKADTTYALYAVWAAKSYEIRYEKNMGPTGVPLPGSTDVTPQTKKFGGTVTLKDCTWAWEGHTFMHWALATTNVTDNTANVDANGDGVVSDAELGNADFSKGYVVLRAVWNNNGSALLYQNDSTFWRTEPTTGSLPRYTKEVGKVAEKWVDGEGTSVNYGTTSLVANRTYKPVYEKLVSFPIVYNTTSVVTGDGLITAAGVFGNIQHSNSDQTAFTVGSSSTTVTGYTANTLSTTNTAISEATFKGVVYEIGGKYVQPDYTLGKLDTAMTSKTFDNAKMAALLWSLKEADYTVVDGNYTRNANVTVYPIFAAKVTGAFVDPDRIEVKYGTPIDVLLSQILTVDGTNFGLTGTPSGLSSVKINPRAYSSSISMISDGGYNPIPSAEANYTIRVRVTPGFGTDPNASYYDKEVRVVVRQASDADKLSTFSLTTMLPTITLESGANAYDVYAALSKVNVFPLKATDGKSYNVDMAEVKESTGTAQVAKRDTNSEWKLVTGAFDNTDISALTSDYDKWTESLGSNKTYLFRVDASTAGNPGLAYQSQIPIGSQNGYDCKNVLVQVNIGAGSIAPFKPAEVVTEDTDERPAIAAGPVYRLYNPHNGDHLFTTSKGERNTLAAIGWQVDAVTFNTPASTDENAIPVYRVYNPISGEHFYTTSKGERNKLVSVDKWRYEGVEFYAYSAKSKLGVPVYRLWSPTSTDAGSHHFTGSKGEYNSLGKIGWNQEGVAFRAVKAAKAN